ncbi:hypothetical protein IT413_02410 [Candidatus Peregrinibacteria bacterium]|nr:hypothetical protein [Candidatus Peregrinibacteria bacterium]
MVVFRRILAGLLVFLFILSSLPTFAVYSVSNTYLRPQFYSGKIVQGTYDFLVSFTAKNLHTADPIIEEHFTETDLKREIEKVFPREMFQAVADDMAVQMEKFQKDPTKPVTISMKKFRDSLVTLSHGLSYLLFESFPKCDEAVFPEYKENGLPTCVPVGVEYNLIAAPFSSQFESAIYQSVPEQIQLDLATATGGENGAALWLKNFDTIRFILYIVLICLLIVIAFLIYKPFSLIVFYEGFAFLISGVMGYFMAYGLGTMPQYLFEQITKDDPSKQTAELAAYLQYLFDFLIDEMQRISLTFLALGGVLLLVRFFMISRYRSEQV